MTSVRTQEKAAICYGGAQLGALATLETGTRTTEEIESIWEQPNSILI